MYTEMSKVPNVLIMPWAINLPLERGVSTYI